ncbi:unnamed protein product [Onchocerca flexuosa]|uniref:Protein kinase domain-containing protein n=1 Tax=Onchocerca flexuosa TaxID=387005 RepID=A0A183HBC0_9BILA|nr:unnamed protein product [Onchocerca flexuosa]
MARICSFSSFSTERHAVEHMTSGSLFVPLIRLKISLSSLSLSRLSLVSVQTLAQQLYSRISDSIASLGYFQFSNKRRRYDRDEKTIDVPLRVFCDQNIRTRIVGRGSLRKSVWPVSWLEAIFLPEFPNNSNITEKDFLILNCIGEGTFSKVYRVCLKLNRNFLFAMKKQLKSEILTKNAIQQVKNEASIHVGSFYPQY